MSLFWFVKKISILWKNFLPQKNILPRKNFFPNKIRKIEIYFNDYERI